jgi:DNA-binding NtrC family response regulator
MMSKRLGVLLVEDDRADQMAFECTVKREEQPYDCRVARSVSEDREALNTGQFDMVLLDHWLGDGTVFLNLTKLKFVRPSELSERRE